MTARSSSRSSPDFFEAETSLSLLSQLATLFAVSLLVVAVAALQVSLFGKSHLVALISYATIALAALIALAFVRFKSAPNFLCLISGGIFFGYIILRALASREGYAARADLYLALAVIIVYGLTVAFFSTANIRLAFITALLALALVHVFVQLVQFGLGENFRFVAALEEMQSGNRASGLYFNPDHLAGLFELLGILGLSIACWSRWPSWVRIVVGYLALVLYFGLALTASRGGYASAALSLLAFAILSVVTLRAGRLHLEKSSLLSFVLALVLFGGGIVWLRQTSALDQRLQNIAAVDQTRVDLWHAAITQWKLNPVFGTGAGTYRFYGREFRVPQMQLDPLMVHDDYLHLLCEYGAVGALAFLFFLGAHLRSGWQTFLQLGPQRLAAGSAPRSSRFALNLGALCVLAAYALHSAVDFNLHVPANALLVAFIFGMLANPGLTSRPNECLTSGSPKNRERIFRALSAVLCALLLFQLLRLLPGEYFAEETRDALENENPKSALALSNRALEHEQNNPNIYFYQGRAFEALAETTDAPNRVGYLESALDSFQHARALSPLDGNHPLDLAFIYDQLGRFPEAEWMFALAHARDPQSQMIANSYRAHLDRWKNSGAETSPPKS